MAESEYFGDHPYILQLDGRTLVRQLPFDKRDIHVYRWYPIERMDADDPKENEMMTLTAKFDVAIIPVEVHTSRKPASIDSSKDTNPSPPL